MNVDRIVNGYNGWIVRVSDLLTDLVDDDTAPSSVLGYTVPRCSEIKDLNQGQYCIFLETG